MPWQIFDRSQRSQLIVTDPGNCALSMHISHDGDYILGVVPGMSDVMAAALIADGAVMLLMQRPKIRVVPIMTPRKYSS